MKQKRLLVAVAAMIVLTSCGRNAEVRSPELVLQDLKTGLRVAEISIVEAGFVLGELVKSGNISESKADGIYGYGGQVLSGIRVALIAADEAESVEAGQRTLLAAITVVAGSIGDALDQFDLPEEVRLAMVAVRSGLVIASSLAGVR